jgi:hypothetical protein
LTKVCDSLPRFPRCFLTRIYHFLHAAGKDFVHQLNMVCKVIGTPTAAEIAAVPSDKARAYLASMPYFPKGGQFCSVCMPGKAVTFDPAALLCLLSFVCMIQL